MPASTITELELLSLAKRGDSAAFGELVRRDLPLALCQAMRRARNHDDAWDIAQEAYRKAWLALPAFNAACPFSAWRHAILHRVFLDLQRKRCRRCAHESAEDPGQCPDPAPTPERLALDKESRAGLITRVRAALSRLNPAYRTLLKLVDMRRFKPCAGRGSSLRRKSRYSVVLRYFRLLSRCPALSSSIPYGEGLELPEVRRLYRQILRRNAYDLKLLHARQAFMRHLEKEGPLTCDTRKPDLPVPRVLTRNCPPAGRSGSSGISLNARIATSS